MSLRSQVKIACFILGGVLASALLAFGGLLFINSFDESLNPAARAALEARHDSVAPEDNLYFAVLGLGFAGDASVDELGRQVYAGYVQASRANPGKALSLYADNGFKQQPVAGDASLLCGRARRQEDCIERVMSRPDDLRAAVTANRALIERYESLRKFEHLQNPVPLTVNSPILEWRIFLTAKRLWLTDLALQAGDGHIDAAIDAFKAEFAFTRRALAEPDILLIDKMVLAGSARMDVAFISDLARNLRLSGAQYAKLAATMSPLTVEERSLAPVLAREYTAFADILAPLVDPKNASRLLHSNSDGGWLRGLEGRIGARFLKYNASMNAFWANVERNQAMSSGACVDLAANRRKMQHAAPVPVLGYVYNPIGKLLSGLAASTADEYVESMCDLQGMVGIVALQLAMGAEHVADAHVAEFIKQSDAGHRDPYTGMPFEWLESGRSLSFRPGAERDRNYFPWPLGSRAIEDLH